MNLNHEAELQTAITHYENLVLQVMQVDAQMKLLGIKRSRLIEDMEQHHSENISDDYYLAGYYEDLIAEDEDEPDYVIHRDEDDEDGE
jgi:GTP cyclohydrolase FolE2